LNQRNLISKRSGGKHSGAFRIEGAHGRGPFLKLSASRQSVRPIAGYGLPRFLDKQNRLAISLPLQAHPRSRASEREL